MEEGLLRRGRGYDSLLYNENGGMLFCIFLERQLTIHTNSRGGVAQVHAHFPAREEHTMTRKTCNVGTIP